MKATDLSARILELVPREGLRQLVAILEEYLAPRRATGRRGPDPGELPAKIILDRKGRAVEVEVPRRFGW